MQKNEKLEKALKNIDYQIKEKELLKEILFLRQYGTKNSELDKGNINIDIEK